MLLKAGQVPESEIIGFTFAVNQGDSKKRSRTGRVLPNYNEGVKRTKVDSEEYKDLECSLCKGIFYQPITIFPCFHNVFFNKNKSF